ncbi:MAG: hypothetical protein ACLS61_05420 [Ruminococcus sp.]
MTAAYLLFKENYNWNHPIRSLGIRAEKSGFGRRTSTA